MTQPPKEREARGRKLSVRKKIVFSLIPILLFVFLAELACRLLPFCSEPWTDFVRSRSEDSDIPDKMTKVENILTLHPVYHHRWKSRAWTVNSNRGFDYYLYTNKQGWVEERDISVKKPEGHLRIFLLGDSNTEGVVNSPNRWAEVLERQINEHRLSGVKKVEVINTGTSSYSPILCYLRLREEIMKYSPDMVILAVDMTDCVNDDYYERLAVWDKAGQLYAVSPRLAEQDGYYRMTPRGLRPLTSLETAIYRMRTDSALFFNLYRLLVAGAKGKTGGLTDSQLRTGDNSAADWMARDWNEAIEANVARTCFWIRQSFELCSDNGVLFSVVTVPHYPQFSGEASPRPHHELERYCSQMKIAMLNGYEQMKDKVGGTERQEYYYEVDPTHLNKKGNALFAGIHLPFLVPLLREYVEVKSGE